MITIYNFARGARGMRVVWQCEEMGLPYRLERLDYPVPADYRARHSLGSVPFLEYDGVAMAESIAMMLYLAERHGPTPLLPGPHDPRLARVLHLTVFGEAGIAAPVDALIGARFGAPDAEKDGWLVRTQTAAVERRIAYVVEQLGDRPYLVGDDLTLADLSVGCALGIWKGALDQTLPDVLVAWRERLAARPAHQRAAAAIRGESRSVGTSPITTGSA